MVLGLAGAAAAPSARHGAELGRPLREHAPHAPPASHLGSVVGVCVRGHVLQRGQSFGSPDTRGQAFPQRPGVFLVPRNGSGVAPGGPSSTGETVQRRPQLAPGEAAALTCTCVSFL